MELPNYNRQLMQQLHTLRKEGQFCDCTILVGEDPHRAHKLVLAASSLLFKSVLEGSDSISIDPAVVTSQEFSNLLEIVYTGKLPPGRHNLTRVIATADSLQMFDVAVSCKNILTSLMKQSPVQSPIKDPQSSGFKDQAAAPDTDMPSSNQEPSQPKLTGDMGQTKMEVVESGGQEVNEKCSEDGTSTAQLGEQSAAHDLQMPCCKKACLESPDIVEDDRDLEFLSQSRNRIIEVIQDVQPWVKALETWEAISSDEKQVILECCKGDAKVSSVLHKLLNKVTEHEGLSSHTLLALLDVLKEVNPGLAALLQKRTGNQEEDGKGAEGKDQALGEKPTCSTLLDHTADLIEILSGICPFVEIMTTTAESCLDEQERKVVLECCTGKTPQEAVECLMMKVVGEGEEGLSEEGLLKLLHALKQNSPSLEQLLARVQRYWDNNKDHKGENQDEELAASLLARYRCRLSESALDPKILLHSLEAVDGIAIEEKECIQALLKEDSGTQCVDRMLSLVLEGGSIPALTVWRLLFRAGAKDQSLGSFIQEVREEPGAQRLLHSAMDPESLHLDILLKHRALILELVGNVVGLENLAKEVENAPEDVSEFIRSCRTEDKRESVEDILGRVLDEQSLPAQPLCTLLTLVQKSFPQLLPLKEDLEKAVSLSDPEAVYPGEAELRGESWGPSSVRGNEQGKGKRKECFCQWCGKSFAFMCRMEVHRKRCRLSQETRQQCPQCPEELPTPRALKQHLSQAHQTPVSKKRKRQEQVACDICGKTFAHPSGMLYHKRTEHFDEKPYMCKECGAKFAANSSLKNHMRLHTGERPFLCKHCDMSFSQAAALSYHTKKKHSEDIMNPHDCQKCRMSFASVEEHRKHIQECHPKEYHQCDVCNKVFNTATLLMKHMVTHIGKKPFSCKICHKAYQQLSGLWYHNRTTHPEVFAGQGPRVLKSVFQCTSCDKAFCTSASLVKHEKAEHPGKKKRYECEDCKQTFTGTDELMTHRKENHPDSQVFKCLYCSNSYKSAAEMQQHLCSQHFSEEGEAFGCTHCNLIFPTQLEVIQTEESSEGAEQVIALHQSQLGSSQVYVALTDSENAPSGSEIVAVNMDDLLDGTITFICGEGQ
ncbi:hypothetical protein JZ751_017631 [Albula glossodonta]|uniref:Zinc finger and BTB domain-containing protein 40 n=1 Tax=Albula glossodonta TaxID=121402 RepID=A0A8T2PKJ1_9TELE|nr:hypothetical protein JZ751_017631 [Albula glossodonta]